MIDPHDYPERALDAFNRRDLEALGALWAEDFRYRAPGEGTSTRAQSLARERRLFAEFPDLRAKLRSQLVQGERLFMEVTLEGTQRASGRAVRLDFAAVFQFEGGLARSERIYYDRVELQEQLA
jgi:ketosteroid isomerase-like protein